MGWNGVGWGGGRGEGAVVRWEGPVWRGLFGGVRVGRGVLSRGYSIAAVICRLLLYSLGSFKERKRCSQRQNNIGLRYWDILLLRIIELSRF